MPKLDFQYDEDADVLTVEGVRWSGDLLRMLAGGLALNKPFVIVSREDGLLVMKKVPMTTDEILQDYYASLAANSRARAAVADLDNKGWGRPGIETPVMLSKNPSASYHPNPDEPERER